MKGHRLMKKRFLSAFFAIVLCVAAYPINTLAGQSIDDQLISRGYPLKLIESMPEEEKEDLINGNCYFESSKVYNYDEDGELINISNFNENAITPYGQIKTAHLSLSITTSKSGSNTVVTFNYNWKTLPVNRYQDPICVAWNSNIFSYKSGSFKKVDKFSAVINGNPESLYTATHSSETSYSKAASNQISWYADLKGYSANVVRLFGYGSFTLIPKKTGQSTQLFGHYVHAKSTASFSIGYSGAGFSVSGGSSYDELGTDITIKS